MFMMQKNPVRKTPSSTKRLAHTLFATMAVGLVATQHPAFCGPQQVPNNGNAASNAAYQAWANSIGGTWLQTYSATGYFTKATLTSPTVLFRWGTNMTNAAGGKWCVTYAPNGPVQASGTTALAGGNNTFSINFSKLTQQAPQKGQNVVYYVTIQPIGSNNLGLGLPSNVVTLTSAPGNPGSTPQP